MNSKYLEIINYYNPIEEFFFLNKFTKLVLAISIEIDILCLLLINGFKERHEYKIDEILKIIHHKFG